MCSRDVSPAKDRDAEKRRDERRKREGKPVSRAGGFQDLPAVICVVEGSGDPDKQADYEQKSYVLGFHRGLHSDMLDRTVHIQCTTWYIECNRKENPIRKNFWSDALPRS